MALRGQPAAAQELAPRAYWPAPVGTGVLLLGMQRNAGDVLIDPSLPIAGVESEIDFLQVSYQRSLSLFGRSAAAQLSLPYSDGLTEGIVEGEFRDRRTVGFADARFRLAINLRGAPAMDGTEFRELVRNPRTIVGASVIVQAPTGDYDEGRIINVGTNRWSIKPAVGMIVPVYPSWFLEFEVGAWIFGDNDDFAGETREQDPIVSTAVHVVKRFPSGFWASFDANYYTGGKTRVGDTFRDDRQSNSRAGVTFVYPVKRGFALRGSFSTGVNTRSGGDFSLYSLGLLYVW